MTTEKSTRPGGRPVNASPILRSSLALGGALLASSMLLAPVSAQAAPLAAEDAAAACTVTDGTLTWGVKESFRSYISGSIANGSWEASDGATYDTPSFQWGSGTGEIDPATGTGSVSFTGSVHFTGHDGVLDLTLANPTLEFEGDGKATLLLDARSTDATGEVTIDSEQEWVGDVESGSFSAITETGFEAAAMPTTLTNSGAKAFAGFYEPGVDLDPIDLALTIDGCDVSGVAPEAPTEEPPQATAAPGAEAPAAAEQQIPWVPIIIGGVAILVIGVTAGMLLTGRKRPEQTQQSQPTTPADPEA